MTLKALPAVQPSRTRRSPRASQQSTSIANAEAKPVAVTPKKSVTRHKPTNTAVPKTTPHKVIKAEPPAPEAVSPTVTKQALLISLLKRKGGANIHELMQASGWQAHSIRGVISGVLKKRLGLAIHSEQIDGIRHYQIFATA